MGNPAEDWIRLKQLVADALERPPEERRPFIEEACAGEPALAGQALDLLRFEADTECFLDQSPLPPLLGSKASPDSSQVGQCIGGYRLRKLIAHGGMGSVYEADQEQPHRTVALKLLRHGLGGPDSERRFRHEVDILGRLRDPSIAHIYEAGIDSRSGDLFFAMELVDGVSITRYSSEQALDARARLELMAEVADGVHYAHQHGIIHRDLKPDNILVDRAGRVKILDFGIARMTDVDLNATTQRTQSGQLLGTIAYMSPEQVQGDPEAIDIRSDVYSLGVILHLLLTGKLPLDLGHKSLPEILRVILEVEPEPPGQSRREFKGDIDTIVLTALAKQPAKRYASASEFAADLRRYLNDEMIAARPATSMYLLRKFARRNRALVISALLLLLLLFAALAGISHGLLRATRERDKARAAGDAARGINSQMHFLLASVEPERLGGDAAVRSVLDNWAEQIENSVPDQPEVRAALFDSLGWTYYNLELYEQAAPYLRLAVELYEQTQGPGSGDSRTALKARDRLAQILIYAGEPEEAQAVCVPALSRARELLGPGDPLTLTLLSTHAMLLQTRGQLVPAVNEFAEAVRGLERLSASEREIDLLLPTVRHNYALALSDAGRFDEALQEYRTAYARLVELRGPGHPRTLDTATNLAALLDDLNRFQEAADLYRSLLEHGGRLWGAAHPRTLGVSRRRSAMLLRLGQLDQAAELAQRGVDLALEALGPDAPETLQCQNALNVSLLQSGQFERAEPSCRAVLSGLRKSLEPDDPRLDTAMGNLSAALAGQEKYAEAEQLSRAVLDRSLREFGREDPRTLRNLNNHARLLQDTNRHEQALELLREVLDIAERIQPGLPQNDQIFRYSLGRSLLSLRRYEEAETHLLKSHQATFEPPPETAARVAAKVDSLIQLYTEWGRPEQAARWRKLREPSPEGR